MRLFYLIAVIIISGCHDLPQKKLSQWNQKINYYVENDSLYIELNNPLKCPLRISAKSTIDTIHNLLRHDFPILLPPLKDSLIIYPTNKSKEESPIQFSATMGDPTSSIQKDNIELPFPRNKTYKIIQGYNGKFSHTSEYSKYALDFNLAIGDTICAASDGYVVGVIEGYKHGGDSKKWRPYANFITLYHPTMKIYTQYVHLIYNGSFVEVGDEVKSGQAIAISGKTGFTSTAHLHFNVLKATYDGIASTPTDFKEGYKGANLTIGKMVKK
ncbi:MAG: M23 family metallopeptidase [Saprospiraceae bacterium]|nr:M23 family metallopeptidase [Saprospiraceae bacterium]